MKELQPSLDEVASHDIDNIEDSSDKEHEEPEVIAAQHNGDDIFADIMNVPFHCCKHHCSCTEKSWGRSMTNVIRCLTKESS